MTVPRDPGQSRLWGIPFLGIWVRALLLIPGRRSSSSSCSSPAWILVLVSWIPVLVQGRQAPFITQIVGGTMRLWARAALYATLGTGSYPWFGIGNDHPITITYDEYEPQNRLWGIPVLGITVRAILLIPHFFVLWVLGIIAGFLVLVSWIPVLITGRQADGIVDYLAGVYRWSVRVGAYAMLLTGRTRRSACPTDRGDGKRSAGVGARRPGSGARHDGGRPRRDVDVGDLERGQRPEPLGHDDRVVAGLELEVGRRVHERVPAAVDREQRRPVLAAQPRRDLVDRHAAVLVRQADPVELGPLAAGHDVGHESRSGPGTAPIARAGERRPSRSRAARRPPPGGSAARGAGCSPRRRSGPGARRARSP